MVVTSWKQGKFHVIFFFLSLARLALKKMLLK